PPERATISPSGRLRFVSPTTRNSPLKPREAHKPRFEMPCRSDKVNKKEIHSRLFPMKAGPFVLVNALPTLLIAEITSALQRKSAPTQDPPAPSCPRNLTVS